MENNYTSHEFFHLVGYAAPKDHEANYEILSKVLRSGWVSHHPHNNDWGEVGYTETNGEIGLLEKEKLIIPTVTCYADIPFKKLQIHTHKYGLFGIGFPSSLLIQYGARPVTYIPMSVDDSLLTIYRTALLRDIEAATKGFNEQIKEKNASRGNRSRSLGTVPRSTEEAIEAIESVLKKDLLAYIKPFKSELAVNDRDNYYMEREWRKYGNMKCTTEEVAKIVVAKGYKKRITHDFPEYDKRIIYEI